MNHHCLYSVYILCLEYNTYIFIFFHILCYYDVTLTNPTIYHLDD